VVTPPPAPTCTLSATPTSIPQGSAATIVWNTTNATSVTITGAGAVGVSGSRLVTPTQTTTYTLTATGASGTVNCTTTVTVVPPTPQPTCALSANPTSIVSGNSTTLNWQTTNASYVAINGIGAVAASGYWGVTPTQTTTYVLTATGNGGTVTCQATVTVVPNTPSSPSCTLSIANNTLSQGQSTTLTWSSTNTTSMTIDQGVGSVNPSAGSTTITPSSSRTYTATASGPGGTVTCAASVSVNIYHYGGPTCSMSLDDYTLREGDDTTLRWSTTNVNSAYINNGVGNVGSSGTANVSPNAGTYTYRGTFYGNNGEQITCLTTLRVEPRHYNYSGPSVSLTQLPSALPLASLSLASLPYTGLDLGPLGTAVYWLVLLLWSVGLAYLIYWSLFPGALKNMAFLRVKSAPHSEERADTRTVHSAPVVAHATPAVHTAHTTPAASYASYEGFKAEVQPKNEVLSIEDIVKGLSRQVSDEHMLPATPLHVYSNEPAAQAVSTVEVPRAAQAPGTTVQGNVPAFIAALLGAEKDTVFAMIRELNRAGHNVEEFLMHVTVALDDAYRAKIDGTPVHPEVARVCSSCAPNFLERVIAALSTAVDSSYVAGVTGVKLALTRALQAVEG